MLHLVGESQTDYFLVMCKVCKEQTHNEYLGWDPGVPHFRATCIQCGERTEYKLRADLWSGLPSKSI